MVEFVLQKVRELMSPTDEWGPALVKHRQLVTYVDDWVLDPWVERGAYLNKAYSSSRSLDKSYISSRVGYV